MKLEEQSTSVLLCLHWLDTNQYIIPTFALPFSMYVISIYFLLQLKDIPYATYNTTV